MAEMRPPTNGWDVAKIAVICIAACFVANASLASNLGDLSEVRGGGLGALVSVGALAVARKSGLL